MDTKDTKEQPLTPNAVSRIVIGCAMEVHSALGAGVLESAIATIKCVEKILPVHLAQLLTSLKLSGYKLGLLLNFNVPHMRDGIRRVINGPANELDE